MTSADDGDGIGPWVTVRLPDGQDLRAMVLERRWEPKNFWWYRVSVTLLARDALHGVMRAVPSPVEFWAPAASCSPLEGEDYTQVPTTRARHVPRWLVERRSQIPGEHGPLLLVHRGDCASIRGSREGATAQEAWQVLQRPDAGQCPVCRPEQALLAALE
ncbi:DUF6233 domain-containing protein [Streptomyces sp. NPDC088354]|uniref:DUF6233 domain-containing protein n=1 Tax=Streptomyces sp. NPDC088354 TaxID=3365856 RepID=UPI003812483A